jgi:predicted esterase
MANGARGVIVPLDGTPSQWHEALLRHERFGVGVGDADDIAAVVPERQRADTALEGRNSLIFVHRPADARPETGAEVFKFVSARAGADGDGDGPMLERTWFGLYQPRGDVKRGVILLIPGMFGTPRPMVDAAVEQFRDAGWAVVRMLSHPSRFTERFEITVDTANGVEDEAARIAETLGQRVAEAAYAASAALDEAARRHEWIAEAPHVALGMSGGAMILSSVIALEPDRYDAAVAIAGGADFLGILMHSNYATWIGAAEVHFANGDGAEKGRELRDAYLACAPLDSYHTARFLRDIPTLMIHGTRDRAVPAAAGDLLWERAGQPTRWSRAMGHEALFIGLLGQVGSVVNWINEATDFNVEEAAPGSGDLDQAPDKGQ